MYSRDKMKELLDERDKLSSLDEFKIEEVWKKILSLLQSKEDLDKFTDYMDNEMTYDEFGTLTEFVDDINTEYATKHFVEALKKLFAKYPNWLSKDLETDIVESFEEELNRQEKEATEE
ncbi:hypothetical protein [Ligilactobacillus ceti]|uniref:Uncharacterized protein n=1 Tax=Ligilactobacillus ceti DSM 22408 TaxID=1122146 RepID=A0A0R2KG38_9LACO|nr:hypothetical protein [Ligilactobacillus ceti]KRN88371.1 hypothetical protein IV53_GL000335 [Ligilactobacillus ceti DSM 22408]